MSKHTPGPWQFYTEPQPNGCPIVGDGRGLMVAMLAHSIHYQDQKSEALANARLIAAAPDLLEALAVMTDLCAIKYGNLDAEVWSEIKKARAAIAKATGQS